MDLLRRSISKLSIALLVTAVSIGHLPGQDKRVPELHPLTSDPLPALRMVSQTPGTLYETIARFTGINVVWDPAEEKQQSATARFTVELSKGTTLREALDKVASATKTSWTPISDTTISVKRQQ